MNGISNLGVSRNVFPFLLGFVKSKKGEKELIDIGI